jgi:hypothetical protein
VLGEAGIREVLGRNALSLTAMEAVSSLVHSETVSSALQSARTLQSEAAGALERGEGETALILAFRTADVLWEVTPERVATDLIEKANEALGRNQRPGAYSEEELTRIRRLMYGASEALDEGDYPRAIRRAYYACQLLGTTPP